MDPHHWHLQSIIIDHDHPYCRPSYLDPISTLCIEPTFKSHQLELNEGAGQGWIDIESDETELDQSSEPLVTETTSRFADFCASNPIEEPKCDNNQTSSETSSHVTWNIIVDKLYRNIRKTLMQIDLESSIFSQMSKHKFDEFRYRSYQELLTKRVARHIRKAFTSLNWRIDTSVELHESLLNTLPSNLLLSYLNGYAGLMHHSRVLHLLRRLNAEIISRHGIKRFDYAKYLEYASLSSKDGSGSSISRSTYGRLHDGSASSFSPITFIPTETLICGGLGSSASTPGRASSMMDEPTFMCLIAKGQTQGSRINKMLKNLSQLGRLMIIPMSGTANVQIRRLIRHFVSVQSEDPRPIPIYLIGFGEHCDIVLTAAITSPYLLPSSNGGALEEIICGRLASTDAPVPTKPWLAGLVLIAPPKTAYRLDCLGGGLDNIARRCSLLLVISSKHQVEATAFRDALLTARRRSTAPSAHCGVTSLHGTDWKVPYEFDLRMLVIGGADHLLRMHPATLRRFATTQGAIDLAIVTAIKNLVAVSRTLVNASTAPVSTHGTGTLEVSGNRSAIGLPTSWLSNTNAQQTARKGVDGTPFARKASILRGSVHARNFSECHPPQTRSPKQDPSFLQRNRMAYSGSFRNPVSGYDDGSHVRASYNRHLQQNSTVPVFFGTRAFRRETGESVMDASSHDSVPQAKNLNHSAQSAPYGYGRMRSNRFYNRN